MIKAIETSYKGYRFRSRLEARYAVAFDAMGIDWKYEDEGYELPGLGRYLPDFYLPAFNTWIEIKGQKATDEEINKCSALCESKGPAASLLLMLNGDPRVGIKVLQEYLAFAVEREVPEKDALCGLSKFLKTAPKVFIFEDLFKTGWLMTGKYQIQMPDISGPFAGLGVPREDYLAGVSAAKSARFEFGESGARKSNKKSRR